MSKLLVTGGMGFIGSHFIRYMLEKEPLCRITNLDALTYAGNPDNLRDIEGDERYAFVHIDLTDRQAVEQEVAKGYDGIVHFAAESHVDHSIAHPDLFVRTNVLGTLHLLEAARKYGVGRFVHVSTDEVYGTLGSTGAFTEDTPLAPNSPYSASKASSDLLVRAAFHTYGFPAMITRCSNNYGSYQFPEKLIPVIITSAANDHPVRIYGDGLNVRDWLHVRDHCSAVALVLQQGEPGEVYNIGGNNERTNLEVARTLLEVLGKPESLIVSVKDRLGHDRRYAIDASKIKRELGWQPLVSLEEGLQQTAAWYLNNESWCKAARERSRDDTVGETG
ncbi:dTDP-glucose 4,6-dehydratase [Paenibacillaceae bacterium]|nr:dTDP-glucose 4,6-dehydratase [Paenibacillaceae bacterium]